MTILELEDFDIHAGILSVVNEKELGLYAFSPLFVYLIYWAEKNGFLGDKLKNDESFKSSYRALLDSKMSFSYFVQTSLMDRLEEDYFDDEVLEFVIDYIEMDGYVLDLTQYFDVNIGSLPDSLEKVKDFKEVIEKSMANYKVNKKNFPELAVFTDPDELISQQEM